MIPKLLSTPERYFYHSFPRRAINTIGEVTKGLTILRFMKEMGLLLTP